VDYIVRHEAVQKMREGPSESAGRSPMNREVHVGLCEGVGVKFPRATRPLIHRTEIFFVLQYFERSGLKVG